MKLIKDNNVDYIIANPYYKKRNERFLFNVIEEDLINFFQVYGGDDNSVRIFKINQYGDDKTVRKIKLTIQFNLTNNRDKNLDTYLNILFE